MTMSNEANSLSLVSVESLRKDAAVPVEVAGYRLAVWLLEDGRPVVAENACPHAGIPLDDGARDGDELICSWHGWSFDLRSGECLTCPGADLRLLPCWLHNGQVRIAAIG
jgi:nitrite reductase/ring-hydroxylating ferredoxin subunit